MIQIKKKCAISIHLYPNLRLKKAIRLKKHKQLSEPDLFKDKTYPLLATFCHGGGRMM